MKKILLLLLFSFPLFAVTAYSQPKYCADSSIRIRYIFNQPNVVLFNNYDTAGWNIFIGSAPQNHGIMALKTSWGDSIYWAKIFFINNVATTCFYPFDAPNGSLICTGVWGNSSDLLICRIDTNGTMLWANRFRLSQSHSGYNFSNQANIRNILVTGNAIYFNAELSNTSGISYQIVAKLDLTGNIIWSKSFKKNNSSFMDYGISDAPVLYNDTLLFVSNITEQNISGQIINRYLVITKLNDSDGSRLDNMAYKIIQDNTVKGIVAQYIKLNTDNTLTLTGSMSIALLNGDLSFGSNLSFNLIFDGNFFPISSFYYKSNPSLNLSQYFNFDFNKRKQSTFLYGTVFNNDKYFITFDNNNNIQRSRKFLLPPTGTFRSAINFDDKQNIHFAYNYQLNNNSVLEYVRISDLAAANTEACFGIDTSILQAQPFMLIQEPFSWDLEYTNLVKGFPVNFSEQAESITRQLICKQISYCDSVKIKGNQNICFPGPDTRYSVYLNSECLKSLNWQIDTAYSSVVNTEADSTVTLHFKKCGSFYLRAAVNNCVVKDSLLVTISAPQSSLQLNRDSLLCPGGTTRLTVNPFFKAYQWQDGSSQAFYNVMLPGLYRITATDSCGNIIKDSINISYADTSLAVPSYYAICYNDSASVLFPSDVYNITWQPPGFGTLNGNKLLLYSPQTATYAIQAKRAPGCSLQKSITIAKDNCPEWVRFPSAFTPNNDGLNDYFRPGISGKLASYSLRIFERNGQVIFNSNNPYAGWNGTVKGVPQNGGVYVFMCRYHFTGKPELMQKGALVLIR